MPIGARGATFRLAQLATLVNTVPIVDPALHSVDSGAALALPGLRLDRHRDLGKKPGAPVCGGISCESPRRYAG
jgi:hypothetical protein